MERLPTDQQEENTHERSNRKSATPRGSEEEITHTPTNTRRDVANKRGNACKWRGKEISDTKLWE